LPISTIGHHTPHLEMIVFIDAECGIFSCAAKIIEIIYSAKLWNHKKEKRKK
jgi:hypothetical protein